MITYSNQIELRHLRYFRALAQDLHFHRAADKLFISQPALSRQIKQLEGYMGVQLFLRDKKQVELTQAGLFLREEVDVITNQLENAVTQSQIIHGGREGCLKIGFVGSAMQNVIPELIIQSTQEHSKLSFTFEEMRNTQQLEKLKAGALDLGFVRLNKVPDSFVLQRIFNDTFSLVLPQDHPITAENFCDMSQLADEPFILFQPRYSPAYYMEVLSICEDKGFTPHIAHNTVNASTIYRLVQSGLGVSIVPTSLREGYDIHVRFIELQDIRQRAELSIVYSKNNRNPSLRLILEIIHSRFPG